MTVCRGSLQLSEAYSEEHEMAFISELKRSYLAAKFLKIFHTYPVACVMLSHVFIFYQAYVTYPRNYFTFLSRLPYNIWSYVAAVNFYV